MSKKAFFTITVNGKSEGRSFLCTGSQQQNADTDLWQVDELSNLLCHDLMQFIIQFYVLVWTQTDGWIDFSHWAGVCQLELAAISTDFTLKKRMMQMVFIMW